MDNPTQMQNKGKLLSEKKPRNDFKKYIIMFSFRIEPSLNTDLYVYTTNVFVFTFNMSKTEFVVFLMQMKKK